MNSFFYQREKCYLRCHKSKQLFLNCTDIFDLFCECKIAVVIHKNRTNNKNPNLNFSHFPKQCFDSTFGWFILDCRKHLRWKLDLYISMFGKTYSFKILISLPMTLMILKLLKLRLPSIGPSKMIFEKSNGSLRPFNLHLELQCMVMGKG